MKIIDIDCALGYIPRVVEPGVTAEMLISRQDSRDIACSVAYDRLAQCNHRLGNARMRERAAASGGKLQACYVLGPYLDGIGFPTPPALEAALRAERPACVRLFPEDGNYPFTSFYCDELLQILNRLRLPLLLKSSKKCSLPEVLPELTAQYPSLPFVVLGMNHGQGAVVRTLLRARSNVYFSTGVLDGACQLDALVAELSSEHFLYGSGMPELNPDGGLGLVYMGRFSDRDRENIFFRNWTRLQEGIQ